MRSLLLIVPLFLSAILARAQTAATPEFEVASIRASGPLPQGRVDVGLHIDGAQFRVQYLTLRDYIGIAYRVAITRISGPDWVEKERYDIDAKLPEGAGTSKLPEMIQTLLEKRFHLKLHHEQKEFSVYALVAGNGPLRLKEVPPERDDDRSNATNVSGGGSIEGVHVNLDHGSSWSFVPNRFEAKKLSMAQAARELERFSDRPIVDMTGLKGQYDFAFDINPEDYRPLLIRSAIAAGSVLSAGALRLLDNSSPSALVDAVAQTGLRLERRKGPKMQLAKEGGAPFPNGISAAGHIASNQMTTARLATLLSRFERNIVIDETGLKGPFEIHLDWTVEPQGAQANAELPAGPSVFTAVEQQLGLRLESRKGPLDLLVVDHAEKAPADN